MKVSALTGTNNYFEDFTVGEVLKHARGKTVEPLEQVWITNVTMNTAEGHFNEHLMKSSPWGKRLGFGGVTISMCIGLAAQDTAENALMELGLRQDPAEGAGPSRRHALLLFRGAGEDGLPTRKTPASCASSTTA